MSIDTTSLPANRVLNLNYSLVLSEFIELNISEPLVFENDEFEVTIDSPLAVFHFKTVITSIKSAKNRVDQFVLDYNIKAGLDLSPGDLRLVYKDSEMSSKDTRTKQCLTSSRAGYLVAGRTQQILGRFPEPLVAFKANPDAQTMYLRYEMYSQNREPLLSMANMCLTILEASAARHMGSSRSRQKAAAMYGISMGVLSKLGDIVTTRGDAIEARKAPLGGFTPLIEDERRWVICVIKALIQRVGEWAYDHSRDLKQITLNDFPRLRK